MSSSDLESTNVPLETRSDRLEQVRKESGVKTLREFHELIGGEDFVSYSGARNYHNGREPSAEYLLRVATVFPVRLEWLLGGQGPMTYQEAEARRALGEAEADTMPDLYDRTAEAVLQGLGGEPPSGAAWSTSWLPIVLASVYIWQRQRERALREHAVAVPDEEEFAGEIGRAIRAPLKELRIDPEDLSDTELSDYALAMTVALGVVARIPPRSRRDHTEETEDAQD